MVVTPDRRTDQRDGKEVGDYEGRSERMKKEHPMTRERRVNEALREENRFLNPALLFTEILAAGFFGAFLAVMGAAGWL